MRERKNDRKTKSKKTPHLQIEEDHQNSSLNHSILGVIIIFTAILLIVGMFLTSQSGSFGIFIKNVLLGCFGAAGFFIPPIVFYLGWAIIMQAATREFKKRILCFFSFLILFSCLLYLFSSSELYNSDFGFGFGKNVQNFYIAGKELSGGGVIGALLTVPLILVFGNIGTGIIISAAFAVVYIILTGVRPAEISQKIKLLIERIFNSIKGSSKNYQTEDRDECPTVRVKKKKEKEKKEKEIFDFDDLFDLKQEESEPLGEIDAVATERSVEKGANGQEKVKTTRQPAGKDEEIESLGLEHNATEKTESDYVFPPLDALRVGNDSEKGVAKKDVKETASKLEETLASFGVSAKVVNFSKGPTVTRYELSPGAGVKVSKIVGLSDDLALNLAAPTVRIEAPIPGKAAVGIEIPNKETSVVLLRDIVESKEFGNHPSNLAFAIGKDIAGRVVIADIAKMPHLLIAGATGSGKSVCINTLISSVLYKARPEQVKLLMVDPKVVELGVYNGIPHLLIPVVTDPKKAAGALNWAVQEMVGRYNLFAQKGVRDLKGYNELMQEEEEGSLLPQILIIIDELADLMMVAPNDVEDAICRLAQMARAAGMHLVIATQRPSVDVITGVIKANIPSRISFAVSSQIDSRTILDMAGAEKLLGKGDMLYYPIGEPKPIRLQGAFVTDKEVEAIVDFVKTQSQVSYNEDIIEKLESESTASEPDPGDNDILLPQVADMIIETGQASISIIQRRFKVGYARAARLIDQLEARGVIGGFEGSKPRKILMSKQQWEDMKAPESV